MDSLFIAKVALSFLVAGAWIALATVLSERFGSKIGGLIACMPSNIVVTLFFIGITQTPQFASDATAAVPVGETVACLFLFVFIITAKKYGNWSFVMAFAAWALLAPFVITLSGQGIAVSALIYAAITLALVSFMERMMRIPSVGKKKTGDYKPSELAFRAAFSGGIVATAVVVANYFGPLWGGVMATFPAAMFSTMYLLKRSQGTGFAMATGKAMVIASSSVVVYGIAIGVAYPAYGLVPGTAISYAISAAFAALLYPFMARMK